ncbi:testis-expressed protein 12 [Echeneis naucrates]|uniref:testis-expressed protein 12 n=1 Tax=Echeneis naucrates TaxID=173247 RepID=UPI00111452DF|nr:testis-expressed protein 12 [Echeneis naucrates]
MNGAPVEGKVNLPAVKKRTVNNNVNKSPEKPTSREIECTPANQDRSPPKKRKLPNEPSTLESGDLFEATAAGATREVNMLLSKFAKVLSERAAADAAQMKELEGVLTEARNLESFLKDKKNHLRQTLALISDKLQG